MKCGIHSTPEVRKDRPTSSYRLLLVQCPMKGQPSNLFLE